MPHKPSGPSATPEQILYSHTPEVKELAERLRQVIRQAVPEAVETANRGWHSLSYRHPTAGYFCGLFPFADRVDLVLEFGALLPDPDSLLEGDGFQVRYVRLRRRRDIRVQPIKRLLAAALSLPVSRATKFALIKAGARPVGLEPDT